MSVLTAVLLGLVQGIAEFLPISSSGHLVIFNHLLASQGSSDLLFDVLVHLGTFLAVLVAFWRDVLRLLVECFSFLGDLFKGRLRGGRTTPSRNFLYMLVLSLLPLFLVLPVKGFIELLFQNPVFVGFALLYFYRKKRKFNGDITLRYLIWYGAGRFWIEALRTDSLMLVPSIGLRVSQLVAGLAVIVGLALEIYLTRKHKDKPLLVPLALNADNRAKKKKLDGPIAFFGPESSLPASASRTEFLEKTAAWNKEVGEILDENLARQQKNG
mgnify:CR=1 FL=1